MTKQPHKYRDLNPDMMEEHFSNFLIDSWSFSKVNTFARHEKVFEMSYIYCIPYRRSATEVAGSAYHKALKAYFVAMKEGVETDIIDLQQIAYTYIDEIWPNSWKLQKTTPTIEECREKATKSVNALLKNFMHDISVYMDDVAEILAVEEYYDEFLTINGVDIPLPAHGMIDLIALTKDGKRIMIDHKSKTAFSDEQEMKFSIGKQAITYHKLYEAKTGEGLDEVWFIENKIAENKDKSPQLNCFKMTMDDNTIRLYEAMLYEPLKRMIEAIQDPDYIYLINENDNFVDKAEIYDFWARTMIAEVDDFNIPDNKKPLIEKRLKKIRNASLAAIDPRVIKNFRKNAAEFIKYDLTNKDMSKEQKIEHTLKTLGLSVNVAYTFSGYSSDTFLLEVSAGVKLSEVSRYKLDIASALNVSSIRMYKDLYVHEGRAYIAIEAMKQRDRFLYFDEKYSNGYKIPMGIDNFGQTIHWNMDNPSTPHMLICGSTGSGKSVSIISIIEYAKLAGIESIIIFDPKFEFGHFAGKGIQVYNDIEEIEVVMETLVDEMNNAIKRNAIKRTLIVFDEFADAVANSRSGKDLNVYDNVMTGINARGQATMKREVVEVKKSLEENLRILLQKGRSIGFRIVAATQRASVKVITGDAKVNFPVQVCFKVPKEVDSKVVIDESGAESLSGKGDGLIKSPEYQGVVRFQAFYKEMNTVTI